MAALPDPETILPVPDVPQPPQPPHLTIGRGGRAPLHGPQAPRFRAKRAPHAPGNPVNKPQPQKIIHIYQGKPAVKQPTAPAAPAAKPTSQAGQQRETVKTALGKRISDRMAGMPAENQRLFQSLIRGHAREHAKAYHEAGKGYLRSQLDDIKARAQGSKGKTTPAPVPSDADIEAISKKMARGEELSPEEVAALDASERQQAPGADPQKKQAHDELIEKVRREKKDFFTQQGGQP